MAPISVRVIVQSCFVPDGTICWKHFPNVMVVLTFINFNTQFDTVLLFANFKLLVHFDPGLFKTFFSNCNYLQKFQFV